MRQPGLFDGHRMSLHESIDRTAAVLRVHAGRVWVFAWSGGKDSTLALVLAVHLIESGAVPPPAAIYVVQVDTRQELLPLLLAASEIRAALAERGIPVEVLYPPLDHRFLVYVLGRGVPPPSNRMRWCTDKLKIRPVKDWFESRTCAAKPLLLTGVRRGESAARDGRIALSCTTDGAECGQGRFLPGPLYDTEDPVIHWRVCHVWAYLRHHAPDHTRGEWPTALIADAYGGDEAEEVHARTGCVGCPLAARDRALEAVVRLPQWSYLTPLTRLRELYWSWRSLRRLRKPPSDDRRSGQKGPLTPESRAAGLAQILAVQAEVNEAAARASRPPVELLTAEEEGRIRELIAAGVWPDRWDGTEPYSDDPVFAGMDGGDDDSPNLFTGLD